MGTKSQPETVMRSPATITKGKLLGYTLVVALSLIWGLAFVAIRRAAFELSPVNLTIIRWLIASAGFLLLAPIFGRPRRPIQRQHVPRILLVSFASVTGYHLSLNYAESIVSSGLAGLLISFGPIFAVLLSAVFLKERIETRLMLALASAVAGALVLSVNTNLNFGQVTGPLAVILAAFMYGVFSVGSKPLVKEYGALPTAIWVAVIGTVFTLPLISSSLAAQLSALSSVGWLSVVYLAVLSTVVANMMLYTLIRDRAVSRLSVQLYLVPLASLVGGVLLLGESVSIFTAFGALLLFVGIALATHTQ
ncbi:MAG TPA: DMT family transporter [Candidatus Bathyarchaeia archaeon]|nr:DMT family transporter [Candidatus Bathyarchaeia archaeon]